VTEERSAERLIVFVDAVVAIAITLLVLPLAEVPRTETGEPQHSLLVQIGLDLDPLAGFVVSFFVIARFWWGHHRTFAVVRRWSRSLVLMTMVWLFTIVLLPAVTALAFEYDPTTSPLPVLIYVGTMLASALSLTALAAIVHLDPNVAETRGDASRNRLIGSAAASIAFALALVIGTLFPLVNYWAIWLIAITGPFERLVRAGYRRRDTRRGLLAGVAATPAPALPSASTSGVGPDGDQAGTGRSSQGLSDASARMNQHDRRE
jgi:uncharacterized membrane protein